MGETRTVTALKAQKRNPERINVYLDGEFAFGLARIVAAWLHIGQVLSDEKIEQMRMRDSLEKAYQLAVNLLSYRPRAEAEITRGLRDKGYSDAHCAEVVERLKNAGLVGDGHFARQWVENRVEFRPRSHRMIAAELRQKGVAEEAIRQALDELPDEEALAYDAAKRASRKLSRLDWETFRKRMYGHLARKGFGFEATDSAIRRVWKEVRQEQNSS